MIPYKEYKHGIPIQIRFSDVDRLDHVNNACYLSFFELGRVHYFNTVLHSHVNWDKKGFVLARTEIDYFEPVFLNDEVRCYTKLEAIGTKSLRLKNCIVKKNNNDWVECASGYGILVAMDYEKKMSIELPEIWKTLLNDFENAAFEKL